MQDVVAFHKTGEAYGGLSNMAAGFPVEINDTLILTSEALYQACRFPHMPEVQKIIIEQKSPMAAKMKSKASRKQTRPDWDNIRVNVMRWCLRIKLLHNWNSFLEVLLSTNSKPIVELSKKDDFWGAKATESKLLVGCNILGRLLMELREEVNGRDLKPYESISPPEINNFLLYGKKIGNVVADRNIKIYLMNKAKVSKKEKKLIAKQLSFWD